MALVMGMEYKVLIPVRNAKEPEGFLKRLFGGKVKEQHGIAHIEKLVMIGWIAWVPDKNVSLSRLNIVKARPHHDFHSA